MEVAKQVLRLQIVTHESRYEEPIGFEISQAVCFREDGREGVPSRTVLFLLAGLMSYI
jgi:hypothetical protein